MKIKHIWSVLCKESIVNQDDNNISINGVLEELSVFLTSPSVTEKLPEKFGLPINYEVVSMWQKISDEDSAKATIEYIFIDPDKNELLRNTQDIEMTKTTRRHRSRMKIVGMPLRKAGDYIFQVKLKEDGSDKSEVVAEIPLEIKINLQKAPENPQVKN